MVYNIVCVADNNYAQHLAVMLASLFYNNEDKQFAIYILCDRFSTLSKERIIDICCKFKAKVKFVEVNDNIEYAQLNIGQWNPIMYYKLLTYRLLPSTVERYLFLDVDMLINGNIDELYNIPLNDKIIAACEDIPDCITHKERLGLKSTDAYINSGVMVIDLDKWRNRERTCSITVYIDKYKDMIINDQDLLALYFRDYIEILPIKWNMVTFYFMKEPKIFDKYKPELQDAKRNPRIIHFAAPIKPWFSDCDHPYRNLYKKYLKKTPWIVDAKFPRYEHLTFSQRFNKLIKHQLSRLGLYNNPMLLSK